MITNKKNQRITDKGKDYGSHSYDERLPENMQEAKTLCQEFFPDEENAVLKVVHLGLQTTQRNRHRSEVLSGTPSELRQIQQARKAASPEQQARIDAKLAEIRKEFGIG